MIYSTLLYRSSGIVRSANQIARSYHGFHTSPIGLRSTTLALFATPTLTQRFSSSPAAPTNDSTKSDSSVSTASKVNEAATAAPGRVRQLWNQYGYVAIGTYGSIYLATLGSVYLLLEGRVISAGDSIELLQSVGIGNLVDLTKVNPKAGNFAVAWILTKFTEPARAVLTFVVTPRIAKLFRFKQSPESTQ